MAIIWSDSVIVVWFGECGLNVSRTVCLINYTHLRKVVCCGCLIGFTVWNSITGLSVLNVEDLRDTL